MQPAGSLASRIADHVQKLIASGELSPGDRLPGERELAELLSVGRSSVREAVQALAALGVLSVRHGHGVFVNPKAAGPVPTWQPAVAVMPTAHWVDEFYAMRKALEGPAARWAAGRATPQAVASLDAGHARLAEAVRAQHPPEELWRLNAAFHEAIVQLAGNRLLLDAVHALNQAAAPGIRALGPVPGQERAWLAEHAAILHAVKTGDGRAAERAARSHVRTAHHTSRSHRPG